MKFFSKHTLMFAIFCIGSCVLLRSAPLHESINLANADDFVEAARGKYPQLNSLFDFLSQSLMDLRDDVLKARSEKIAKNIKCYVPSCEDFPTFFELKKKNFPSASMWDKNTPEAVMEEAEKYVRLHAQERFAADAEEQETLVSTVLTLLEEMKQVCTKNFDEAFEAIYGEQGKASNPSLYNLPQWSLFWAMLLQLPSFYERQAIKTNLALDWQESFDALHALKDTDRETLYDLAREKDFFSSTKSLSAWSAYDVKAEIEEILPTLEPKPTLLLACGRAQPVSMHLLTLGAPENVITACYRCCSKHHGADVLTVDADPRQLPDIFADFNQKRFWCMLPDDSFKEVLLEEPDIAKGWDETEKACVRDMLSQKTHLKVLKNAWNGEVLLTATQES